MGAFTANFNLYKPAVGETGWGALVDTNWDTIDANLTNGLPRQYRSGCATTLSGGTPSTVISITAGDLQDAGNAGAIRLASTMTKNLNATWAVGSGNGGLAPTLILTASTWYHLFVIKRTDTGVVDAYFDTSITAANIPASYTLFRRIAAVHTDANKLIHEYLQQGRTFEWKHANAALPPDLNTAASGTNAGTVTCLVPLGIKVKVLGNAGTNSGGTQFAYFSDPDVFDEAPSSTTTPLCSLGINTTSLVYERLLILSNTASQLRYRTSTSGTLVFVTLGWEDFTDEY